jgi:hypothetical protein
MLVHGSLCSTTFSKNDGVKEPIASSLLVYVKLASARQRLFNAKLQLMSPTNADSIYGIPLTSIFFINLIFSQKFVKRK